MHPSAAVLPLLFMTAAFAGEHAPARPIAELSHIHGVVLPAGSDDVLLATHHGLYSVDAEGMATMISATADDFMGFTTSTDGKLFASGHPASRGNTGVIGADHAGSGWILLSPGANGPVDFHAMTVSPSDPQTLYGSYGGIQASRNGGLTWSVAGPGPDDLIDLAAAADDPGHLYAGTITGLYESFDFGRSWAAATDIAMPVTALETAPDGTVWGFIPNLGLHRLNGSDLEMASPITDAVILHMAFDPDDPARMVAVTSHSEVLSSGNGGKTWSPLVP